jgi:hypothetical protein
MTAGTGFCYSFNTAFGVYSNVTRRLAAWLAIFGMALNALWPLLANAAPMEFSAPVCSMVGTKATPANSGLPIGPAPGKLSAPHCPFCPGVSDHTPALAPYLPIAIVAPIARAQPVRAESALPVSFLHLAAHPRGPPPV